MDLRGRERARHELRVPVPAARPFARHVPRCPARLQRRSWASQSILSTVSPKLPARTAHANGVKAAFRHAQEPSDCDPANPAGRGVSGLPAPDRRALVQWPGSPRGHARAERKLARIRSGVTSGVRRAHIGYTDDGGTEIGSLRPGLLGLEAGWCLTSYGISEEQARRPERAKLEGPGSIASRCLRMNLARCCAVRRAAGARAEATVAGLRPFARPIPCRRRFRWVFRRGDLGWGGSGTRSASDPPRCAQGAVVRRRPAMPRRRSAPIRRRTTARSTECLRSGPLSGRRTGQPNEGRCA